MVFGFNLTETYKALVSEKQSHINAYIGGDKFRFYIATSCSKTLHPIFSVEDIQRCISSFLTSDINKIVEGNSILHFAILQDKPSVVYTLLTKYKAELIPINGNPLLYFAARYRTVSTKVFKIILDFIPNCKKHELNYHGQTALFPAIYMNNIEKTKLLLDDGFDLNVKDSKGFGLVTHYLDPLNKNLKNLLENHKYCLNKKN